MHRLAYPAILLFIACGSPTEKTFSQIARRKRATARDRASTTDTTSPPISVWPSMRGGSSGKGRHAPALNFGDCMAYAVARVADEPLLCTGDDFPKTDLELAESIFLSLCANSVPNSGGQLSNIQHGISKPNLSTTTSIFLTGATGNGVKRKWASTRRDRQRPSRASLASVVKLRSRSFQASRTSRAQRNSKSWLRPVARTTRNQSWASS